MRNSIQSLFQTMMDFKINQCDGRQIKIIINRHPSLPRPIQNITPIQYTIYADVSKFIDEYDDKNTSNKKSDLVVTINIADLEKIKEDGGFIILPPKKMQDYKVQIEFEKKLYSIKDESITGFGTQKTLIIGFDS